MKDLPKELFLKKKKNVFLDYISYLKYFTWDNHLKM